MEDSRDAPPGDESRPTQFGRLLDEFGVTVILARSPPSEGRIERSWGTFQHRLTSELRPAGAATRGDAEHVLSLYRSVTTDAPRSRPPILLGPRCLGRRRFRWRPRSRLEIEEIVWSLR